MEIEVFIWFREILEVVSLICFPELQALAALLLFPCIAGTKSYAHASVWRVVSVLLAPDVKTGLLGNFFCGKPTENEIIFDPVGDDV